MKLVRIIAAVVVMAFAHSAFAGKVVVFDAQAAILTSNAAKAQIEEFERNPEVAAKINEAKELQQELKDLEAEGNKNSLTWGEEQKKAHVEEQEKVFRKLQEISAMIQNAQKQLFSRLIEEAQPKVSPILEGIVKADGISIVLRKEAAFVAMPDADITAKVVAALNKMDEAISGK